MKRRRGQDALTAISDNPAGIIQRRIIQRGATLLLYRAPPGKVSGRAIYIVTGALPDTATGAFGELYAALLTKALSAPSTKAATPATMIERIVPGRRDESG